MSKKKSSKAQRSKDAQAMSKADAGPRSNNIRETVESIAIAFILAFLFRTFEAEAFVIPTGSMAPTLQGRHKDVLCPQCGYQYRASASNEEEEGLFGHVRGQTQERRQRDVVSAVCPICRYEMTVDPHPANDDDESLNGAAQPTYNGDRILVGKFVYELGDPERWDVVVFKFPGDAKTNYIKRLVGLENEEVEIRYGDIYTRPVDTDEPLRIARKPPHKLLAMMQVVHDNRYIPRPFLRANWPHRWQVWPDAWGAPGWQAEIVDDQRHAVAQVFSIDGNSPKPRWIRYQHLIPQAGDWNQILQGSMPPDFEAKPQLITDFYAYNNFELRGSKHLGGFRAEEDRTAKMGLHWVGDLMLKCEVDVESTSGEVLLDLVEGGTHFLCRIDVATGQAGLSIEGQDDFAPVAQTDLTSPGSYELVFANVDDELRLWIDGSAVEFDKPSTYHSPEIMQPVSTPADAGDLAPAGVGSHGAKLRVTRLELLRDIYYIADTSTHDGDRLTDYHLSFPPLNNLTRKSLAAFLSDPSQWEVFTRRRTAQFSLHDDQFFMLGDNSPFSADSRLWSEKQLNPYVERELLIGKALFIYWPHSWNRIPGTPIPFPFFPNFPDMGFVR